MCHFGYVKNVSVRVCLPYIERRFKGIWSTVEYWKFHLKINALIFAPFRLIMNELHFFNIICLSKKLSAIRTKIITITSRSWPQGVVGSYSPFITNPKFNFSGMIHDHEFQFAYDRILGAIWVSKTCRNFY